MKTKVQLVVVGSVALDSIETPRERRKNLLGGSCSYACSAASFFTKVGMVGVVGSDFPAGFVNLYRRFGVDLAGLRRVPGKTFRWSGVYEPDMINRRTLSTELNVFGSFSPELPAHYASAPFVLLGNISPELQSRVLRQTRRPRFVVADTMDLWINTAHKPLKDLISRVDMLTLNDSEARLLTGKDNLNKAGREVLAMGPRYVVVKKGEHGAVLFSKTGVFFVPPYPVDEVNDPTGAGDSFAGAFMGALARHGKVSESSLRKSLLFGSVVASFCVREFSLNTLRGLRLGEIERRVGELQKMTECG